jgi:hypothetical protein
VVPAVAQGHTSADLHVLLLRKGHSSANRRFDFRSLPNLGCRKRETRVVIFWPLLDAGKEPRAYAICRSAWRLTCSRICSSRLGSPTRGAPSLGYPGVCMRSGWSLSWPRQNVEFGSWVLLAFSRILPHKIAKTCSPEHMFCRPNVICNLRFAE